MTETVAELYSLLVPLADTRLVVPRACVAEVAAVVGVEAVENAPSWLIGRVPWSGRTIPLVSFEGLCGEAIPRRSRRTRAVIFRALGGALQSGHFAVITQGFPQLVRLNPEVLAPDEDHHRWPEGGPVLCQVRMINQRPLIPDLERVEQMIVASLDTA